MTPPREIRADETVFITCNAVNKSFRFVPTKLVVRLLWFIVAYVVGKHEVAIHELVYMSNHFHILLTPKSKCLPDFMNHLNSLTSRALNALRAITGANIEQHYNIVVPQDEEEILRISAYIQANPCEADLVTRADKWRGVSTARMNYGEKLELERPKLGLWKPRVSAKQNRAGRKGRRGPNRRRESHRGRTVVDEVAVFELKRPPVLAGLSDADVRSEVRRRVREREAKAEDKRAKNGRKVAGMNNVRRRNFLSLPEHPQELFTTTPSVSASDSETRVAALGRRAKFIAEYRASVAAWIAGDRTVTFPHGTWLMWRRFGARCAGPP